MSKNAELDYLSLASDRLTNYLRSSQLTTEESQFVSALQAKIENCVIEIAAFGLVSRGKTAVLNALLGKPIGATGALHGTTKAVISETWQQPNTEVEPRTENTENTARPKVQLKLTDTPGLDEIDGEERTKLAKAVATQADLILFIIAGDISKLELEALTELHTAYKPILLVFNKIDLYPDRDREAIYTALQSPLLQQLISPAEIVLTAAEPLPTKVRIQYAGSTETTEVLETPLPKVTELKQKILTLLNQEGKALLAVNAMRALAELQDQATLKHLQNLPTPRTAASLLFFVKAIALGISPAAWLDAVLSLIVDAGSLLWRKQSYPLQMQWRWTSLIALNSVVVAGLGWESDLAQIAWLGASTPIMLQWLQNDLRDSSGWGSQGARTLIQKIVEEALDNSLLKRIIMLRQTSNESQEIATIHN